MCVKGLDGKVVIGEAEVRERWKDYFEKLLNEEFEWNKEGLIAVDKVSGPLDQQRSYHATRWNLLLLVLSQLRLLAHLGGSRDVEGFWGCRHLCNKIVQEGRIPSYWRKSWMVKVYKGKGDALLTLFGNKVA